MLQKKDLPLNLVISIKEAKKYLHELLARSQYFRVESENEFKIKIIDVDHPAFYFEINDVTFESKVSFFFLSYKPASELETSEMNIKVRESDFQQYFAKWFNIISTYNDINLHPQSDFLNANEEYFKSQFELVDDDADHAGFNYNQLIYLESYLSTTQKKLQSYKVGKTKEEIERVTQLEDEINTLKMSLTQQTKNQIISKLSKFWAKAQIIGLDLFKDIVVKSITEITVKLITG